MWLIFIFGITRSLDIVMLIKWMNLQEIQSSKFPFINYSQIVYSKYIHNDFWCSQRSEDPKLSESLAHKHSASDTSWGLSNNSFSNFDFCWSHFSLDSPENRENRSKKSDGLMLIWQYMFMYEFFSVCKDFLENMFWLDCIFYFFYYYFFVCVPDEEVLMIELKCLNFMSSADCFI